MSDQLGDLARRASLEDLPDLVALMREFYSESGFELSPAAAAAAFRGALAVPDIGRVWLLEAAGEVAGFIVLTMTYSMEYGGLRGFVDDFFVKERFRRRGLGGIGLAAVKKACEELGVRALLVETSLDNDRAVRVYRRVGFEDAGRLLLSQALAPATHETEFKESGVP